MSINMNAGDTITVSVPVKKNNGYAKDTTFSVSNVPSGITATLNPSSTSGASNLDVLINITAIPSLPSGNYSFILTGNPVPVVNRVVDLYVTARPVTTPAPPVTTDPPKDVVTVSVSGQDQGSMSIYATAYAVSSLGNQIIKYSWYINGAYQGDTPYPSFTFYSGTYVGGNEIRVIATSNSGNQGVASTTVYLQDVITTSPPPQTTEAPNIYGAVILTKGSSSIPGNQIITARMGVSFTSPNILGNDDAASTIAKYEWYVTTPSGTSYRAENRPNITVAEGSEVVGGEYVVYCKATANSGKIAEATSKITVTVTTVQTTTEKPSTTAAPTTQPPIKSVAVDSLSGYVRRTTTDMNGDSVTAWEGSGPLVGPGGLTSGSIPTLPASWPDSAAVNFTMTLTRSGEDGGYYDLKPPYPVNDPVDITLGTDIVFTRQDNGPVNPSYITDISLSNATSRTNISATMTAGQLRAKSKFMLRGTSVLTKTYEVSGMEIRLRD